MKILRIEIVGFGKFRQQTIDFQAGNQLLYGANEMGKSTLYHFIQAMLFGFPAKRGHKKDYTPKDGTSFGGKLWLSLPGVGKVCIERYKLVNRGQAKVTIGDQVGDDKLLTRLLAPLNQELFREVFTFQQEQLSQLDRLQENELHAALISLGISGSKRLLEKRQEYFNQNQKLFKPKGQKLPLNVKLQEWRQLTDKISLKETQEAEVQDHLQQIKVTEQRRSVLSEDLQKVEAQQRHFQLQKINWPQYEEWQALGQVGSTTDAANLADELRIFYQEYQQLQLQLNERQQTLQKALDAQQLSERYRFYLAHETTIQELLKDQVNGARLTDELQQKINQQQNVVRQLEALENVYGWSADALPQPVDQNIHRLVDQKQGSEAVLLQERLKQSLLKEQMEELVQEIDELEEKYPQLTHQNKQPHAPALPIGLTAGALLAIRAALLLPQPWRWMALVVGVVLLGSGGSLFFKNRRQNSEKIKPFWQAKLNQLDSLQWQLATSESQLSQVDEELNHLNRSIQTILPQVAQEETATGLASYQIAVTKYLALNDELEELHQSLQQLDQRYGWMIQRFDFLENWLPMQELGLNQRMVLLREFAAEMNETKIQQSQDAATILSQQVAQLQEKQKKCLQENQDLLKQIGITQPSEIPGWLKRMENATKQEQRRHELERMLAELFPTAITAEKLQQQIVAAEQKNRELQAEINALSQKIQKHQLLVGQMRADGTLDELYQLRSGLKSEINELAVKWGTNQILGDFLGDLATELSDQQLPQLLKQTSNYFALLTENRYQQVDLKSGYLTVSNADNIFSIHELSTGTKDQLIMAIRFGYLALQKEQPVSPVIIDDGWLHYDSGRKRQLARLLAEFGKTYQVICLSSDQEMVSYYQEEKQTVLHLDQVV